MTMKDDIKKDVSSIYNKIQKDTAQSLKEYNDSVTELKKNSMKFWTFDGIKATLFWCVCFGIALFVGKNTFDLFGISIPTLIWQIAYVCAFIPLAGLMIVYIIGFIISIFKKNE